MENKEELSAEQIKEILSKFFIHTKNKANGFFEVVHVNTDDNEIILKHKKYRCR